MRYQEDTGYVYPSAIASIIIFLAILLDILFGNQFSSKKHLITIGFGSGGSLYILLQIVLSHYIMKEGNNDQVRKIRSVRPDNSSR